MKTDRTGEPPRTPSLLPDDIRVRPLVPADMPRMAGLLSLREDMGTPRLVEERLVLVEWFAFHNPFSRGEPVYQVAERDGRFLGHLACMPVEFSIRGRRRRGHYAADLFVSPEARKEGLGFALTMALTEMLEKDLDTFFCMFSPTPLHARLQRRRKHVEMPPLTMYTKILDPRQALVLRCGPGRLASLLHPPVRLGLRALDVALPRRREAQDLARFDERFDRFFDRILPKLGIATVKTAAYLNWKYMERPLSRAVAKVVVRDGEIRGAIVLDPNPVREEFRTGLIMEVVADPDDARTIAALFRAALDHFRAQGAHRINCLLTDRRFIRVLRRFFFVRAPRPRHFFLENLEKAPAEEEYLADLDNWHLTIGESDHNMVHPYTNPAWGPVGAAAGPRDE